MFRAEINSPFHDAARDADWATVLLKAQTCRGRRWVVGGWSSGLGGPSMMDTRRAGDRAVHGGLHGPVNTGSNETPENAALTPLNRMYHVSCYCCCCNWRKFERKYWGLGNLYGQIGEYGRGGRSLPSTTGIRRFYHENHFFKFLSASVYFSKRGAY